MVDRRTMLTVTAGATLGAVVPTRTAMAGTAATVGAEAAAVAAQPRRIPRTLSAVRGAGSARMRVPETDFPLSHLGVRWRGRAARARIRTTAGWTEWRVMRGCGGGPDTPGHVGGSALLVASGAVGYEVAVAGTGSVQTVELNTVDGPVMTMAATVASGMPLPDGTSVSVPYLSRASWGADESLRFTNGVEDWPAEFYPVQTLTVHHTAGANNDPDPAATVRAIYYYDTVTQGWGDMGYHLLIDEAGRVYEGRVSGADSLPVFASTVDSDGRYRACVGAHVYGYNTGNLGVVLLGDFTSQLPAKAAWDSLVSVLAGLAGAGGLNPLGSTNYVNPVNGNARTVATIAGHRDWAATQCPGNLFHPHLPTVREQVAAEMSAPVPIPRKPAGSLPTQPVPRR